MKKSDASYAAAWLLYSLLVVWGENRADLAVPTSSGVVRGKRIETAEGKVYRYLGIPYARSPTGNNRFRPPEELDESASSLHLDATNFGPACYQPPHLVEVINPLLRTEGNTIGEDCLNLNVYVPESKEKEPFPVMIWLPGEGFDYADAGQLEGTYLASLGKVILVTVNYRVSVFGFLCSGSQDAPGNVGLLDQRMAFRWVSRNIAKFGGDPDNVTLFGTFSGSMSISVHLTSSYALNPDEKLFHRVILQSGIAVGSWVFDREPSSAFRQLAESTKCSRRIRSETVECLRKLPAEVLLKHSLRVPQRWRPVVDGNFITEEPLEAVKMGKHASVDVILGHNEHEGSLCLLTLYAQRSQLYNDIAKNELSTSAFEQLIGDNLFQYFGSESNLTKMLTMHSYKYRHLSLARSFIDFCGDLYIASTTDQLARLLVTNKKGKVYRYLFAHRPSFSRQPSFLTSGHGDDALFSLGLVYQMDGMYAEKLLSRRMVVLFANFARHGKPDKFQQSSADIWPEYTTNKKQILKITSDVEVVNGSFYDKDNDLWFRLMPTLNSMTDKVAFERFSSSRLNGAEKKANMYLIDRMISDDATKYVLIGLMCFTIILLIVIGAILTRYYATKTKLYLTMNDGAS